MIHPSAFVSPQAKVHESAIIGPWCLVDACAEIAEGFILEFESEGLDSIPVSKTYSKRVLEAFNKK